LYETAVNHTNHLVTAASNPTAYPSLKDLAREAVRLRTELGPPDPNVNTFHDAIRQHPVLRVETEQQVYDVIELLGKEPTFQMQEKVLTAQVQDSQRLAQWAHYGLNVFDLTHSLAAAFLLTEPQRTIPDLPYPTFLITLPDGVLPMFFDVSMRKVLGGIYGWARRLWVHRFWVNGDYPVPQERYLWQSECGTIHLWNQQAPEKLDEYDNLVDRSLDAEERLDEPILEQDLRTNQLALRIIRNLCSWLESTAAHQRSPENAHALKAKPPSGQPPVYPYWVLGREVKLSKELRAAAKSFALSAQDKETRVGWRLQSQFAVRGHWRHQPYGPGRSARRLQWIEPYWKGPTGTAVWSHVYTEGKPEKEST
jgi:hypothetical protein